MSATRTNKDTINPTKDIATRCLWFEGFVKKLTVLLLIFLSEIKKIVLQTKGKIIVAETMLYTNAPSLPL